MRLAPSVAVFVALAGCGHSPASHAASADGGPGDAASLAAPRPVAPVSVSFLTSRQPTFRWKLPAGADGARFEACADRVCSTVEASFDAAGDHGAPAVDLPAGVLFWRLRPMLAGVAGDAASVTWEIVLPHVDAPVATSWGSMLDADGDGFGDVVVGDSDPIEPSTNVYVHRGSSGGPSAAPSAVLSAPAPVARWASSIASAGDVDGDGFGDLLVGSPGEDAVYVYRGGASGFVAAGVLRGTPKSSFGGAVSGAGDVDGDGYADVVVGAPTLAPPGAVVQGAATVFFGGPDGLSASRSAALGPRAGSDAQGLGGYVAEAGDLDGDGLADVAVWGGIESSDPQYVLVYLGKARPYGAAPSVLLQYDGASVSWLGAANLLACAGDVNGDGYPDLAMSTPVDPGSGFTSDHVSLFTGGPGGPSLLPWRRADSPLATGDVFGLSVAAVDLDQDGFSDVAVSVASYAQPPVDTVLYAGSAQGPAVAGTWTTRDATTLFERELGSPGDVDGDGYPDLLVGFPSRVTSPGDGGTTGPDGGRVTLRGAVEVHAGGPRPPDDGGGGGIGMGGVAARWTLFPPDGTAIAYGATLARP
ncbi:MAG TPA: FG-GAP-like repeat-containing protein [Polyangiaceae bacterium]